MSEWRPIETAPKDGAMILLASADWVDTGCWRKELNGADDEGWTCFQIESWAYEEYAYCIPDPTHWMPLPEPPAVHRVRVAAGRAG
jgi:hypothetical protein